MENFAQIKLVFACMNFMDYICIVLGVLTTKKKNSLPQKKTMYQPNILI